MWQSDMPYRNIVFIASCLLMAAFFISPALMSISFSIILLMGIIALKDFKWNFLKQKNFRFLTLLFAGLILLFIIGYFNSENQAEASRKLVLKLPFLLVPFAVIALQKLSEKQIFYLILVFVYATFFTGTVSSVIYLMNKEYFDPLILQAKPIPINFGYGIFHIQFSVLNAFACLAGIYLLSGKNSFLKLMTIAKPSIYFLGVITLVNILNLHILSARTGLMGFYLAIFVLGVQYFIKQKRIWILPLFLLALLIPVIAYYTSGSFKNRVLNTMEDIETITESMNPNDKSLAMRIEAWKTAYDIIKQKPLLGVGLGDLETEMGKQYELNQTQLSSFNRKNPHNQFLETAIHIGIPGLILTVLIFLVFLKNSRDNPLFLGMFCVVLFSFFFESMLERQVSILFISFFFALFYSQKQKSINY